MKCDICNKKLEEGILKKIIGTYVFVNGKKKVVCNTCQKLYSQNLKEKLI